MNKYIKIIGVWGTTAATSVGLTVAGYTDISSNIITGSTAVCFLTGAACALYDLRVSRVANDAPNKSDINTLDDTLSRMEEGQGHLKSKNLTDSRPQTPSTEVESVSSREDTTQTEHKNLK